VASEREPDPAGRPWITVNQRRVPLREFRICRLQYATARASAWREVVVETVVAAAVLVVVVVLSAEEPTAAAAAVVMPANASRSPQARIERRNA
jgi:hypothetical protein